MEVDLEQIYSLYMEDLYRYVYSLCKNKPVAEDIVQETFCRAYFYVESYKDERIKPWLFKVAYHTFIDLLRKDKRLTYYADMTLIDSTGDKRKSAEEEFFIKDSIEEWLQTVSTLPLEKRNILLLRDYYHFSYQEIADLLNISLSKVKVTLYRCRKEIQSKMNLN